MFSSTLLAVFFFQAEDGIRDYKVTGVQTCALPILPVGLRRQRLGGVLPVSGPGRAAIHAQARAIADVHNRAPDGPGRRSEERRVGKESSSRWSPYHEKKHEEL